MKLKEYLYMLGIKPRQKKYGYSIKQFDLPLFGLVEYAQWNHPSEKEKNITQENVSYLQTIISKGDFCIDIGSHSGDTTVPMALAAGLDGLVLALEPNSYVFPVLNKNAFLNIDKTNIIPLMVAATQQYEDLNFEYSDSGFCNGGLHKNISKWRHGHAFNLKVSGVNLSNVLKNKFQDRLPKLKYIKIDAEGFDLYILNSIDNIVMQHKPLIKAEIFRHVDQDYRDKMHDYFTDKGYTIYKVDSEENYKGQKLAKSDMSNWEHYDIFAIPDHIN